MWPRGSAPGRRPGSSGSTRTPSPDIPGWRATMPGDCTTSSWLFPPATAGVQCDEKWAFVGREEKNCGPDDPRRGDCWDPVALDPEARLVVSRVVGTRTADATRALVRDFRRRTGGRVMRLITSDEYPAYPDAIRAAYGLTVTPDRAAGPPPAGVHRTPARPRLRDRPQDPREWAGGRRDHPGGVRDGGRGRPGVGPVGRQPGREHVLRRAAQRDRPEPVCPEGSEGGTHSPRTGTPTGPRPGSATSATTSAGRSGRSGGRWTGGGRRGPRPWPRG